LQIGKLPNRSLAQLLAAVPHADPRVVVWPGVGMDAAVLDLGTTQLVAKTDPITFATDRIGWYAVNVNANDVAAMGAKPRWFLATLLLPESASEAEAASLFHQVVDACAALGVSLLGGHTEVTYGLDRPVVVGCMLGELIGPRPVGAAGARAGDHLVLAGPIALEGTTVLAREAAELLIQRGVPPDVVARAQRLLEEPGISVVAQAGIAMRTAEVHAMHDPTEGGLATAAWEMAQAAGVGARIDANAVPVLPECADVCRALGLSPLGLLASGSLLIAVAPADSEPVVNALRRAGYPAAVIGAVTPSAQGLVLQEGNAERPLPEFERDELARVFDGFGDA